MMIIQKTAAFLSGLLSLLALVGINETAEYTQHRHFQEYGPHELFLWAFENGISMGTLHYLAFFLTGLFALAAYLLWPSSQDEASEEAPFDFEEREVNVTRYEGPADFLARP